MRLLTLALTVFTSPSHTGFKPAGKLITECISVFQDPVDGRVHAQIFSGLFGFDPLVSIYFLSLNLEVFLEVHSHTYNLRCGRLLILVVFICVIFSYPLMICQAEY